MDKGVLNMSEEIRGMDHRSGHFYRVVFTNVLLNLHAVRIGAFDTLLSETEDPQVHRRWKETVPRLAAIVAQQNEDNKKDRKDRGR
jgi:hypothetical protein